MLFYFYFNFESKFKLLSINNIKKIILYLSFVTYLSYLFKKTLKKKNTKFIFLKLKLKWKISYLKIFPTLFSKK